MYCGFQGPLYLFDPCRLGLFLACCAKGSNRSNYPLIRLPRWPRWEVASFVCGACKQVSEFLKLPSRQCSASRVLDYLPRFYSPPPKRVPVYQVPSVVKNIGNKRKFHDVIVGTRCGPVRRWVQGQRSVRKPEVVAVLQRQEDLCEKFTPRRSGTGRWSTLPMRLCCAACVPCRESGDCRCGSSDEINAECFSLLVISNENSTKNAYTTLWNHVRYLGFDLSS